MAPRHRSRERAGAGRASRASGVHCSLPEPGAYLSGLTPLRAAVDPPEAAKSVTFFVDGRQVCEVVAPPFECQWEAGSTCARIRCAWS